MTHTVQQKGSCILLNDYEIRGNTTAIFLEKADGYRVESIIDTGDIDLVSSLGKKWFASKINGRIIIHAHSIGNQESIYLSRWILGITDRNVMVDYADHNTLDNRRSNLILLTKSGNGLLRKNVNKNNSSGHLGVSWHKKTGKWLAQITHNRKNIYLGLHDDAEVAAERVRAKREELLELEKRMSD